MVRIQTTSIALPFLLLALLLGAPAAGLTLGDLDAGESFLSLSTRLFFTDFQVTPSPGLPVQDLDSYIVTRLQEGFSIELEEGVGPLEVNHPQAGDLLIEYRVEATAAPITDASLVLEGSASGAGAFSAVTEDFFAVSGDGGAFIDDMIAVVTGGGSSQLTDAVVLAPVLRMDVIKDVQLSAAAGTSASITRVEQHFTTPEPSTILCVAGGLAGLALRRRAVSSDC